MKELYIVLIAAAAVATDTAVQCPLYPPGDEVILLPHETDCHKFYMCQFWKPVEKICPLIPDSGINVRLCWNNINKTCDWPFSKYCNCNEPYPTWSPHTPSTSSTTQPTPSTSSTTQRTPSTSSTTQRTPSTPSTSQTTPSTPSTSQTTPSTPSTTNITPSDHCPASGAAFVPADSSCKYYYICHDGISSDRKECPDNRIINTVTGVCDFAEHSNCNPYYFNY